MVTHDQNEAFAMADLIGVMHQGQLEQWDRGYLLYHQPASRYVADFIGEGVCIPARMIAPSLVETLLGTLAINGNYPLDHKLEVLIRPDDIIADDDGPLEVTVKRRHFRGASYLYELESSDHTPLLGLFASHTSFPPGQRLRVRADDSLYPVCTLAEASYQ